MPERYYENYMMWLLLSMVFLGLQKISVDNDKIIIGVFGILSCFSGVYFLAKETKRIKKAVK